MTIPKSNPSTKLSNASILRIATPLFLSILAQNVVNMTDTAFLGRLGEIELGAAALGGVIYLVLFMAGFGFCMGVQILIGQRNGSGDHAAVDTIFSNALKVMLLLAAILFVVMQLCNHTFLPRMFSSDEVGDATSRFLNIRLFGLFFIFANSVYRSLFVGITHTRALIYGAILMSGINIVLDYLLIFGHAGFPAMGIEGAALASVIAEASSVLFFYLYSKRNLRALPYRLNLNDKINPQVIRDFSRLSIYTTLQAIVAYSTGFVFLAFVERLGEEPLAASNILRSLYLMLAMPLQAAATTANSMTANAMGRGEVHRILHITWRIIRLSALIITPLLLLLLWQPQWGVMIFTNRPSLIAAAAPCVWIVLVAVFLWSAASTLFHALMGMGKAKASMRIECITIAVILTYMIIVIHLLKAPLQIAWLMEIIYWLVLGSLCFVSLRKEVKRLIRQ